MQSFSLTRALTQMKIRLKGAEKGHSLLKKKSDALTMRFRQILAKIIEVTYCLLLALNYIIKQTKQVMGDALKEAGISLAEAKFAAGDFSYVPCCHWQLFTCSVSTGIQLYTMWTKHNAK